jgi:hypothetical protein
VATKIESSEFNAKSNQKIVFTQDSFVAFLDKDDINSGEQRITIGKVESDVEKEETELIVSVFQVGKKAKADNTYTLIGGTSKVEILATQIISRVEPEKKARTSVTLSKKTQSEVTRLLQRMYD